MILNLLQIALRIACRSAAQWLKRLPFVNANRVGLWGWSFGGYMTLYTLLHCDEFKVGFLALPAPLTTNHTWLSGRNIRGTCHRLEALRYYIHRKVKCWCWHSLPYLLSKGAFCCFLCAQVHGNAGDEPRRLQIEFSAGGRGGWQGAASATAAAARCDGRQRTPAKQHTAVGRATAPQLHQHGVHGLPARSPQLYEA